MPVENTRVVITGTPRADKAFEVVEISKKEIQRQAEHLVKDEARALAELRRTLGVRGR